MNPFERFIPARSHSARLSLLMLVMSLAPAGAGASPFYLDAGYNRVTHSTSANDHLDDSDVLALRIGWRFTERFALEIGSRQNAETGESGADPRGQYQLTIEPVDTTLGVLWTNAGEGPRFWIVRAGVTASTLDVRLNESFYGIKPAQSVSVSTETTGAYAEINWAHRLSAHSTLDLRAGHLHRPEALGGPNGDISLSDTYAGIGLTFGF